MEQWHQARAQSPPGSPPCSSDALRQVVVGMEHGGDANTHVHLVLFQQGVSTVTTVTLTRLGPEPVSAL